MQLTDSKAISQFILKAAKREDIILKSQGKQTFSYLYIFDVVSAILLVASSGKSCNAYNIADNNQTYSLLELANILADISHTKVRFDIPDELEKKGASNFTDVRLDATKLHDLGWSSKVDLPEGLRQTVSRFAKQNGFS